MKDHSDVFVTLDVAKLKNAVAVAESGRAGDVGCLGEIAETDAAMRKLVAKLATKYSRLTFAMDEGGFQRSSHPKDQGRKPKSVGVLGLERAIDAIPGAWRLAIADRGLHGFAPDHAEKAQLDHFSDHTEPAPLPTTQCAPSHWVVGRGGGLEPTSFGQKTLYWYDRYRRFPFATCHHATIFG